MPTHRGKLFAKAEEHLGIEAMAYAVAPASCNHSSSCNGHNLAWKPELEATFPEEFFLEAASPKTNCTFFEGRG